MLWLKVKYFCFNFSIRKNKFRKFLDERVIRKNLFRKLRPFWTSQLQKILPHIFLSQTISSLKVSKNFKILNFFPLRLGKIGLPIREFSFTRIQKCAYYTRDLIPAKLRYREIEYQGNFVPLTTLLHKCFFLVSKTF